MLLNANTGIARQVNVFVNGEKETEAIEVYIPGNVLEGRGYVVRGMRKDGKPFPTVMLTEPLQSGQYDYDGLLCEKVFGQIRIEIEEMNSLFGEDK